MGRSPQWAKLSQDDTTLGLLFDLSGDVYHFLLALKTEGEVTNAFVFHVGRASSEEVEVRYGDTNQPVLTVVKSCLWWGWNYNLRCLILHDVRQNVVFLKSVWTGLLPIKVEEIFTKRSEFIFPISSSTHTEDREYLSEQVGRGYLNYVKDWLWRHPTLNPWLLQSSFLLCFCSS